VIHRIECLAETEHSGGPPCKLPTKISTFSGTGKAIPVGVRVPQNPKRSIHIHLRPRHGWWGGCGQCGCTGCEYHDRTVRIVRDLPVFEHPVKLHVVVRRVVCPVCGPRREAIPWLDPYARVTTRLADTVCQMAEIMTIKDVSKRFSLAWHTEEPSQRISETVDGAGRLERCHATDHR
jgi:transposase